MKFLKWLLFIIVFFFVLFVGFIAYIIVSATISFAGAILAEAFLSFLGLSVSEPVPTWGQLLNNVSPIQMTKYWWLWLYPGIFMVLLIMSVNLIGEGLRDAVDPKSEMQFAKTNNKIIFAKTIGAIAGFSILPIFVSVWVMFILVFVIMNIDGIIKYIQALIKDPKETLINTGKIIKNKASGFVRYIISIPVGIYNFFKSIVVLFNKGGKR